LEIEDRLGRLHIASVPSVYLMFTRLGLMTLDDVYAIALVLLVGFIVYK
jgi:hypothetical protein